MVRKKIIKIHQKIRKLTKERMLEARIKPSFKSFEGLILYVGNYGLK